MWEYNTETILNSNVGNLTGDVRFGLFENGTGAAVTTATAEDFLIIDGAATLKIKHIKSISHAKYRAERKAKATLNLSGVTLSADQVYRLRVKLEETGRVSSIMQNAYLRHQKPFFYEVTGVSAATDLVAALAKVIKKEMAMTDFKFFKATANGSSLVIEGLDPYTQIVEVQLVQVGDATATAPRHLASAMLGFEDYTVVKLGTIDQRADEGLGNVRQLVKNNRIPTATAINPFGADHGGKPIPGHTYDMWTIEYVTPRTRVGHQVMGALDDSLTQHVFYVSNGAACEDGAEGAWEEVMDKVVAVGCSGQIELSGKSHRTESEADETLVRASQGTGADAGKIVFQPSTKTEDSPSE